jgi:hypothetical protein
MKRQPLTVEEIQRIFPHYLRHTLPVHPDFGGPHGTSISDSDKLSASIELLYRAAQRSSSRSIFYLKNSFSASGPFSRKEISPTYLEEEAKKLHRLKDENLRAVFATAKREESLSIYDVLFYGNQEEVANHLQYMPGASPNRQRQASGSRSFTVPKSSKSGTKPAAHPFRAR